MKYLVSLQRLGVIVNKREKKNVWDVTDDSSQQQLCLPPQMQQNEAALHKMTDTTQKRVAMEWLYKYYLRLVRI